MENGFSPMEAALQTGFSDQSHFTNYFNRFFGLALCVVYPHRLKGTTKKQELTFVAAGFCGICLYYLLENIALTYTFFENLQKKCCDCCW